MVIKKKKIHGHSNPDESSLKIILSSILVSPGGSAGKESACNAGDLGSVPGLGRSPGEGNGYPLQYSGLENSMDYMVHGSQSRTRLSDSHFSSIRLYRPQPPRYVTMMFAQPHPRSH